MQDGPDLLLILVPLEAALPEEVLDLVPALVPAGEEHAHATR